MPSSVAVDPHDSDSSENCDEYTETKVLLGYASSEATEDPFSQLGGFPTFLDNSCRPSARHAKCGSCLGLLSQLVQLDANLPQQFPNHERRLHILACRNQKCRRKPGTVRALRAVRSSEPKRTKVEQHTKSADKDVPTPISAPTQPFDLGASIFGVAPSMSKPTEPIKAQPPSVQSSLSDTFASKARISDPDPDSTAKPTPAQPSEPYEPWPDNDSFLPSYPSFHLAAEYETLYDDPSLKQIPAEAIIDTDMDTDTPTSSKQDTATEVDSKMDKGFQKFADRLAQNPEQVLRYEYRGQPLLYARNDSVGNALYISHARNGGVSTSSRIPRCKCGADRVFEMQLTPHAITELEVNETGLDGMEWGTIILMVCANDCVPNDTESGKVGYSEEWVGVQWEEVAKW